MTETVPRPLHTADAPTSGYAIAEPSVIRAEFQAITADLSVPQSPTPRVGDWRSRHDPASREYAIRALLTASAPVQDHLLPIGPVLDQGADGACCGFAVADASNVLEAIDGGTEFLTAADAREVYARAQEVDDYPGEDYVGTSVLAAMKVGQERDYWDGYAWSFGTRDIVQSILADRPVVLGIPMLSGMYDTDRDGVVTVTGSATGMGHALVAVGVLGQVAGRPGPWLALLNSWGPGYGVGGLGYVHHRDLARLLRGVGEAAVPVVPR